MDCPVMPRHAAITTRMSLVCFSIDGSQCCKSSKTRTSTMLSWSYFSRSWAGGSSSAEKPQSQVDLQRKIKCIDSNTNDQYSGKPSQRLLQRLHAWFGGTYRDRVNKLGPTFLRHGVPRRVPLRRPAPACTVGH